MKEKERLFKEISKKLRKARERAGLSQAEVAAKLELTPQGYGYYENGNRVIGLEYLLVLPQVLGCKLTDLLPDSMVTDYDRARAVDPRLDEIIATWADLSEDAKRNVIQLVQILHRAEASNSRLAELVKNHRPKG